ncbi:MAG: extracellular solute-binding protein, partial [Spirochaetes bacterium]|nr:extracellular solute-binding protein [Spirochaetota bacterium]
VIDQYAITWDPRFWLIVIYQNESRLFNKEKNRCIMSDKKTIEAIGFLNDLLNRYKVAINPQSVKYSELNQNFMTGRIAMYISGVWVGAEFRQSNFRWDVALLPKGKKRATGIVGSGPCMYSKTRHPEEAYEFVKFIVGPEAQKIYSELGVSIPTRKSIAYSECFLNPKAPPENSKVFLDQIKYGHTFEFDDFGAGSEININILQPELDKIWFQNKNPDNVCSVIENRVNEFLLKTK